MGDNMDIKDSIAMLELTIRVFCLEQLLIQKNLISKEELLNMVNESSTKALKEVMEKAGINEPVEDVINQIKKSN